MQYGSEPCSKRSVVIIQNNAFNRSKIKTVIVVAITTNLNLEDAPGNILLDKNISKLIKDSVINISQISTIDKKRLIEKVSVLPVDLISEIDYGLKLILNLH